MNTPPTQPQGVRVIFPDGTIVDVGTIYAGEINGSYTWDIKPPDGIGFGPGVKDVAKLVIDMLPANTTIRFPVEPVHSTTPE